MRFLRNPALLAPLATIAFAVSPASAATNLDFETGNLDGWTISDPALGLASPGYNALNPQNGAYFGAIEAGAQDTYTTLSRTFDLIAGGTISGYVAFVGVDYLPFSDDGYLAINGDKKQTFDTSEYTNGADSGWIPFTFTALTAGNYTLEIAVANHGDDQFSSVMGLDDVAVTGEASPAVPEAATWAMMVAGFGLAGLSLRNRRRAVSFG